MDGHRIVDGSSLFHTIRHLVVRCAAVGTLYTGKNSLPRWVDKNQSQNDDEIKTNDLLLGMDANHQLVRQLENGYRMEKPAYAPNYIGEIMASCWKADPKERPTFSHIEQTISSEMESTVSDHYLNLNDSYEKLNEEIVTATPCEPLGLAKALETKEKPTRWTSLTTRVSNTEPKPQIKEFTSLRDVRRAQ